MKDELAGWVADSKKSHRKLFAELDALLRALDRFFSPENLMTSQEDLTAKDFSDEFMTARDAILRILGILEVVIPESRKNSYWFQKFAETKLLTTRDRDAFRQRIYRQETPEHGLYLLYDSFINLKGILSDLMRASSISYMGFINIGSMVSKEIRENRYFNPFAKGLNPEFDGIHHQDISAVVRSIEDRKLRKEISIIYIFLFRLMRYLAFIDLETQRSVSLNSSLIILILLRSEIQTFRTIIAKGIPKIENQDLQMLLQAVAYQFSMELRRVYEQELRDIHRKKTSPQFRGKIENCHGILKNLTEQSVVQLTQFFKPDIKGEEIFSSFLTKVQQSLRLREDIVVLHRFLLIMDAKTGKPGEWIRVFESLRSYMVYFESFTFRLLRYDDYEEFVQFFNEMITVRKEKLSAESFGRLTQKTAHFRIYLETTLRHIEQRAELNGKSLDMERVESLMKQYL